MDGIEVAIKTTVKITVTDENILPLRNILSYCDLEQMQKELSGEEFSAAIDMFAAIGEGVGYAEWCETTCAVETGE